MTNLIVIDDALPIQGSHFLVRRGWPQIRASILGAHYLADIISRGWAAVCCIVGVIEDARKRGGSLSKAEALASVANQRLKADLWEQEFKRKGGVLEPVLPVEKEIEE